MEREVTLKLGPGQYACVIGHDLAGTYRTWSDPIEVLVEPSRSSADPDVVDLSFRHHECPENVDH